MEATTFGMLAETPIHPGSGRGLGVIDLPVAREAATDYPVVVGSSLKGALKDQAERSSLSKSETGRLFGGTDQAGDLIVSDARLLLLPVRSLTSAYRWATCPHLIERYRRDIRRSGDDPSFEVPEVSQGQVQTKGTGFVFLEERQFGIEGTPDDALVKTIRQLVAHDDTKKRLAGQIAVLHDDDFGWFARYGLSIQARNVLDDMKKSTNLWYEETLPPDTLMYAMVAGRSGEALESLDHLFPEGGSYLQVGGNETIGQGWFAVTKVHNGRGE